MEKINVFWFRRDLRLEDNKALEAALNSGLPVLPVFIFDTNIIDELPGDDARINFIHSALSQLDIELKRLGSSVYVLSGDPVEVWKNLIISYNIQSVYINKDYEPYTIHRDNLVKALLEERGIKLLKFKDQVIFEEREILKPDEKPYTVFTPYCKRWLQKFSQNQERSAGRKIPLQNFLGEYHHFPSIEKAGFRESTLKVRPYDLSVIREYHKYRDIPSIDRTSYLSPHLRFGTVSIRKIVKIALEENITFLKELIWRDFFMQILFHFPQVVTDNFRPSYDGIQWRNDEKEFRRWCAGETGYPIVDAGMRQLNETGFMHNRVRMITAGFLCKHLLINWRWGEAYYAEKLLDYELSSNNGNWQWAAGTGCDAAQYFRIFNPETQQKKFDPENEYIRKWVPLFDKSNYPKKIVDHDFARQRVLDTYKTGIKISLKKS